MSDKRLEEKLLEDDHLNEQFACELFTGVREHVGQLRLGMTLTERDFKIDDIKNIPWKSLPPTNIYINKDVVNCASALIIAGYHNVQLPLTTMDIADIVVSFFMTGAGYYREHYSVGYEVLTLKTVDAMFSEPIDYEWSGVQKLCAIAKKDFDSTIKNAKSVMDLFDISGPALTENEKNWVEWKERVRRSSTSASENLAGTSTVLVTPPRGSISSPPDTSKSTGGRTRAKRDLLTALSGEKKKTKRGEKQQESDGEQKEFVTVKEKMDMIKTEGIAFMMLKGRQIDKEYHQRREDGNGMYAHEDIVISKLKILHGRGQLIEAAVMMSYLYVRSITKSTDHIVTCGRQFASLANKHHLMLDPQLTFEFHRQSVDAMRTHMLPFSPSIAIFTYTIEVYKEKGYLRCEELQYTQFKTLVALRLEYFGMTLLALAFSVAEKMRISVEKLCAYSANTFTFESIRVLLDFLSRLKGQPESYAEARHTQRLEKIDAKGIFKYARMLDSNYFLSLSTTKNVHLVFMWVAAQRLMTEGTVAWETIKSSNVPFKTLNAATAEFLFRIVECMVARVDLARSEYTTTKADSVFVARAISSLKNDRKYKAIGEAQLSAAGVQLPGPSRPRMRSRSSSSSRPSTPIRKSNPTDEEAQENYIFEQFDRQPKI